LKNVTLSLTTASLSSARPATGQRVNAIRP
jgi:hypothetical protein